jgi:hypothetical protein
VALTPTNMGGMTARPANAEAAINRAFLTDVPAGQLDPVVLNAMAVASTPLTREQNELLRTCLNSAVSAVVNDSLDLRCVTGGPVRRSIPVAPNTSRRTRAPTAVQEPVA